MPGGHFLCNETKEAKFTSVPLRRHKVRYAPAPWTGAIRPLPCVGSSGKSPACFGCSVVNALPTPPLRYQLFPGVGYFRFIRKKERLLLLSRLVRSENRFKSPLRSGAGTKFISFRSSKRGPSTPFPCPRFSEKSPACFACSVGKRPHNGSTALATFFGMLR